MSPETECGEPKFICRPGAARVAAFVPFAARRLPRVVVLGSGWGGFSLLTHLSRASFDLVCVSPRNHMLFTPLLPSSAVGTIDFRSLAEPLDAALPHVAHVRAHATGLDARAPRRCASTTTCSLSRSARGRRPSACRAWPSTRFS